MSKASDAGRSFLAGVLAKLPESLRGQAEAAFQAAEADAALEVIGTGALAQPEINRKLDEIRAQKDELTNKFTELNDWYAVNQDALTKYKDLMAGGGDKPPAKASADPILTGLQPADVAKLVEQTLASREQEYVGLLAFSQTMGGRHYAMFGEPLDMQELVANPRLGKPLSGQPGRVYSLQDAYNEKFGERVQAKHKEAEDARINKLVEERLIEERKRTPASQPFPLRHEVAPIDAALTKDGPAQHTLDSAVSLYEQLQATRTS